MSHSLGELMRHIPEDLHEEFEERAGIMEFDGGFPRRAAEVEAWKIVVRMAKERRR